MLEDPVEDTDWDDDELVDPVAEVEEMADVDDPVTAAVV